MADATYTADDVEYMIDTGTFIPCPDCDYRVTIDWMLKNGCRECGRNPWSFTVEPDNLEECPEESCDTMRPREELVNHLRFDHEYSSNYRAKNAINGGKA